MLSRRFDGSGDFVCWPSGTPDVAGVELLRFPFSLVTKPFFVLDRFGGL